MPTAFVIMPFHPDLELVYTDLIKPVLTERGFEVFRADEIYNQQSILKDIIEHLLPSRIALLITPPESSMTAAADPRIILRQPPPSPALRAAQEAPPSPVLLRDGHGRSASVPVPPSDVDGLGERWIETLEPLHSESEYENDPSMIIDDVATAGKPAATSARKLTLLQKERWKAIQKARRKGMSLRSTEREMGIHRGTTRNTWMPRVLQRDNPGWFPQRRHLIPSRPNRVTFTLNT